MATKIPETVVARCERNIRQALADYRKHTYQTQQLDDISDDFIRRLARDSAAAKQDLRELFSKSPVWDEELDALVINGTRTKDPDAYNIRCLANRILDPVMFGMRQVGNYSDWCRIVDFFVISACNPDELTDFTLEVMIDSMNRIAPKAYAPKKKLSRVFMSICKAVGVADDAAGSEFQRLYAQFADELSSRKISYRLYVSINPGHFLTMSNPKCDDRGNTLTSCHSLNSSEYDYNNGCSGYARDRTSFLVFTASDPENPETLNNRKTSRQLYAYKPGNGLLLQSRMYNTAGGVYGAAKDTALYRDIVQREISMLEGAVNLWKTYPSIGIHCNDVKIGCGFGGYADWTYDDFDGHVCIRRDHENDYKPITVGTWGLCIVCGDKCSSGLYCEDCDEDEERTGSYCDVCHEWINGELYDVLDENGGTLCVCEDCMRDYEECFICGEYHHHDRVRYIAGRCICQGCLDEHYFQCDDCGEWHRVSGRRRAYVDSNEIEICEDCRNSHYITCPVCGDLVHEENAQQAVVAGALLDVCDDCIEYNFCECPVCGELHRISEMEDGICPECHAKKKAEEMEESA